MTDVFLGLGSNRGDRIALLEAAITAIGTLPNVAITGRSSIYQTEPVGPIAQDPFFNLVISLQTAMAPEALLKACHDIETKLGRNRATEIRWGPRPIDIDVIAYGDISQDHAHLQLPHPRFAERAFVIVPLYEIAPDLTIGGQSVKTLFETLDRTGVVKIGPAH